MQPWYPVCPPLVGLRPPVRHGAEGAPTSDQLRGPAWRRTSRGLHVPVDTENTVEQRIIEAAGRLPADGMVTGWAALRMARAAWFDGRDREVPLLLPHASRIRAPGVEVTRTRQSLSTPVERYGVRCAPPLVALLHELRREPDLRECVVMIDMALLARVVGLDEVRKAAHGAPGLPAGARQAAAYASGECRSAPEVRMSLVWQFDAGFPRPLMNREVLDLSGRRLAVVDLIDPVTGTYGEYDGEMHRTRSRHRRDTERADVLRRVGLESFTVVAGDSRSTQVARMQSARGRATRAGEPRCRWRVGRHIAMSTLTRPLTVDERALLDAVDEKWWETPSGER